MAFIQFSPLNQRRITQFKSNRRGYIALWLFLGLFCITLFSEFIANENPIIVRYKNEYYAPLFYNYPETTFGGELESFTNFRDAHVQELIKKDGWFLFTPIPYSPSTVNYGLNRPAPSPPSLSNWLGTDDQGRDVLCRLLYGYRTSILFGLILTFVSAILGVGIGASQGYFGGCFDLFTQRITEIWAGLPVLYLLIIMSSMIVPSFLWLLGIMMLFNWMVLSSVVRAEFLRTRSLDYVRAAEAMGVSTIGIIARHILPNAMVSILTYVPFILNTSISTLTALDFLGFGLPPGEPSLGELITQGKNNTHAIWLGIVAFIAIGFLLSLLSFIGEAVRDAFDPRKLNSDN